MKHLGTVFGLLALLMAAPWLRLGAQDVSVGAPVWTSPDPEPDVLPAPKGRLRPDYPDEMRKTDETGYVIIRRFQDEKGKSLSLNAVGTHTPFQRAVERAFRGWEMRPALRGGQPVNGAVWIGVIFNPKSAATKGTEATPRLLAVTPVYTAERPTPAGQPPVVRMRLSLDATGAITKSVPETEVGEKVLAAIQEALSRWRFAPARRNGEPIAADLVVPVLCQSQPRSDQAQTIPAKVIHREEPVYPLAMRRFGLRGQVQLDFKVDVEGHVKNAVVVQSDNPAFDEPAVKALRAWKFQPATRDGRPVPIRQRVSIVFGIYGGGRDVFSIEERGDQSKLPPELRFDTPPKVRGVQIPVYPYAQWHDEVRGRARVSILINEQGRVAAVKTLSADRPEFGLALTAALEGFTFDPALRAGRPVPHLLNYDQIFNRDELPDDDAYYLLDREKKHPERILSADRLDQPLKPISRRNPIFPVSAGEDVTSGSALLECLVDEDGRARLPRIIEASAPAFGYAAMQAVAGWWFEPPKAGGKPVVVRVRVPFKFEIKPPAPKTSGG